MTKELLNNVLDKYRSIEYMYRASIERHPNATNNEYLEGYANAIKHFLDDLIQEDQK